MTYNDFLKFLNEFNKINTFIGKIDYANRNLNRIASGTGRIVYDIDGNKVFKLAKNTKGISQNDAESSAAVYKSYDDILTDVIEYADDDSWLIAEKAKKITSLRFKELIGYDINQFYAYLANDDLEINGYPKRYKIDPTIEAQMHDDEQIQRFRNFIIDYDINVGDFGRISSYGEIVREGIPTLVLTDYGLTKDNYNTHYTSTKNKSYVLHELFFGDGNDDILSDIGGSEEIRMGNATIPLNYVSEDGSSNFSTDNTLGRDNFPIYNQIDTSPSINNDSEANSEIDEDLEYNHASDATKDQYSITERIVSAMPGSSSVEVKKKCRLAGNGNTSTACNQGDIKNLNIKSLKETVNINLPNGEIDGFQSFDIINNNQVIGEIDIINRDNGYIILDKIFIHKNYRGKGYANEVIQILFKYADKFNKIITLTPDNIWGANMNKLKRWYQSLGFTMNKGRNKDFTTMQLMYRLPKTLNEGFNGNSFDSWFSGSQVVDNDDKPLVVYHGTNKKFDRFNLKNAAQPIIWFSSDKNKIERGEAGAAGTSRIVPAYLSIKKMAGWNEYEKYGLGQLYEMGYDGAKLDDDYFVFSSKQIKILKNKNSINVTNLMDEINKNINEARKLMNVK
jgi:GNAT superfamily N-acetyltransferase